MLRALMNKSQTIIPSCISRSAFQLMFHQALALKGGMCAGLLGAKQQDMTCIQHIMVSRSESRLNETLMKWGEEGVVCIGLFHMSNTAPHAFLVGNMPSIYTKLSISLDEKGRLDLLACLCDKSTEKQDVLSLDLIEDGQPVYAA